MKFRHSFKLIENSENTKKYYCDGNLATITLIDGRAIKVTVCKTDEAFIAQPKESDSDAFGFGDIEVKIDKENLIISYYKNGKRLFADRAPLSCNFENEFGKGVFHYVTREQGERIYGLGDKSGELNKAGKSYVIDTSDSMGYDGENSDPLYKHVPFYICENSVGSYGIFYNTLSPAVIDLGREHNNYYEHYKFFHSFDETLEYYVFFGNKLEILQQFCALKGKQPLPPKWSFDYCASTMAYTDATDSYAQMLGFIERLKEYDLSCRGFYLSSGYTSIGNQRCVFNWNYEKFPDPAEFIRVFRDNSIEIIPNIKPSFLVTHPMYGDLAEKGYFIKNPDGTPFVTQLWDNLGSYLDFTNPDAYNFWKEQVKEKLLDLGITSTWNDNNEFDIKDCDAVTFSGEKACEIKPKLTYLMVKASFEAQTKKYPMLRPFLSTRSGNADLRTLAQTWSGDNFTSFKDLRYCHYIGLTMSLSGFFFYGHDLGGFSGDMPSRELLMRWLQHGLFEPRFTIHSWNSDGTATMPWSYPDIMPSVRAVFAQRKQLIPYLYSCAYNAVENEIPMNAPLFLYYDDEECYDYPNTMLLGKNILAAFVFDEGEDTASTYLPSGDDWYLGGRLYRGGQTVEYKIPALSEMKYLVRAGSVIPTDEAEYGFNSDEKLIITVYPVESGSFEEELFFDDGVSYNYKSGGFAKLRFKVNCNEEQVSISVEKQGKMPLDYELRLCNGDKRRLLIK